MRRTPPVTTRRRPTRRRGPRPRHLRLPSVRSEISPSSVGSRLSVLSVDSTLSVASAGSILSIASAGAMLSLASTGSILSVGSAGSILSIGSAGSILSIGSVGSILSVGSAFRIRGRHEGPERRCPDDADDQKVAARTVGTVVAVTALASLALPTGRARAGTSR